MCVFLDHLWVLFPDVVMVLASEVAVDIVKHAFITKFNDISADVSFLETSLSFRLWCSDSYSPGYMWAGLEFSHLRRNLV